MAWTFRRSIKIAPGVRLNFSKTGHSWSIGPKGFKVNSSKRGTFVTTSIPGTGVYNRRKVSNEEEGKNPFLPNEHPSPFEEIEGSEGCGIASAIFLSSIICSFIIGNWIVFPIMIGVGLIVVCLFVFIKPSPNKSQREEKALIEEAAREPIKRVNELLGEMDRSQSINELRQIHEKIILIMENELKEFPGKFNGVNYDGAIDLIEKEYSRKLIEVCKSINN